MGVGKEQNIMYNIEESAKRLKELRRNKKVTQEQVANDLKISVDFSILSDELLTSNLFSVTIGVLPEKISSSSKFILYSFLYFLVVLYHKLIELSNNLSEQTTVYRKRTTV